MIRLLTLGILAIVPAAIIFSLESANNQLDPRLQRLDRNSDGQISKDEIPSALLPYLIRRKVDANGDAIITAEESKHLTRSGLSGSWPRSGNFHLNLGLEHKSDSLESEPGVQADSVSTRDGLHHL